MSSITDRDEIIRQLYEFAIAELDPDPHRPSAYIHDFRLAALADKIVSAGGVDIDQYNRKDDAEDDGGMLRLVRALNSNSTDKEHSTS